MQRIFILIVLVLTLGVGAVSAENRPNKQVPSANREPFVVAFSQPLSDEQVELLQEDGIEIVSYLPDFKYKVRMTTAQKTKLQARRGSGIVSIVPLTSRQKVSPSITQDASGLYTVQYDRNARLDDAVQTITQADGTVWRGGEGTLVVVIPKGAMWELTKSNIIDWVEPFQLPETHNDSAGAIMGLPFPQGNSYGGAGQIIAVTDTGIGHGDMVSAHIDVPPERIVTIRDYPAPASGCIANLLGVCLCSFNSTPDGAQDGVSGHGTHVAVSAVGNGRADGIGIGTAPEAKLVFQAVEDYAELTDGALGLFCSLLGLPLEGYFLFGIPVPQRALFDDAYQDGSRILTNSWGAAVAGVYDANSAGADQFAWENQDALLVFSSGNSGADADADGIVDPGSVGSPATAKNVLTVGASENYRAGGYPCDGKMAYEISGDSCQSLNGQNPISNYSPFGFGTDPLATDLMADDSEQMAAFSSRGPTSDGRIKPDVVAPGTYVLSGYSDMFQQGYDASPHPTTGDWQLDGSAFPYNQHYKYFNGTSMSTPLVAGAAATVRSFYASCSGQAGQSGDASSALVKATLINTADDLTDENNDGVADNAWPIPNIHEGWGRVNLRKATSREAIWIDAQDGISTLGEADEKQYRLAASGQVVKISLVWTDAPGDPAAESYLVNDLDLTVIADDGAVYRGNQFEKGWGKVGGTPDRLNNVEAVYLNNAQLGKSYTIVIQAHNLPAGEQPFALYVSGAVPQQDKWQTCQLIPTATIVAAASIQGMVSWTYWLLSTFTALLSVSMLALRLKHGEFSGLLLFPFFMDATLSDMYIFFRKVQSRF